MTNLAQHSRIRELDGIRGIAILMVLIWHYITCQKKVLVQGTIQVDLHVITTAFWSGVDLFFVLSGFLIGGIILDNHRKENFLKVFMIRRSCRILPLLLLLLAACWLLQAVLDPQRFSWLFKGLMPWWSYLTFTQNIVMGLRDTYGGHFLGVTWSLAVEEQFYLLAPALILIFGKTNWIRGLLPLVFLAFILRLVFPGFHTHVNTCFRMDALLSGVIVAVLIRSETLWASLKTYRASLLFAFLGLLVITGGLILEDAFGQFKHAWFALLYSSFLLVTLLYQGSLLTFPLRSILLCFWGSIAYGLYMYHQAVSGLLHGWLRDGAYPTLDSKAAVWVTVLAFVVSTALAWLTFHTYEVFFLKIGKRFQYGADKSSPQVVCSALE